MKYEVVKYAPIECLDDVNAILECSRHELAYRLLDDAKLNKKYIVELSQAQSLDDNKERFKCTTQLSVTQVQEQRIEWVPVQKVYKEHKGFFRKLGVLFRYLFSRKSIYTYSHLERNEDIEKRLKEPAYVEIK